MENNPDYIPYDGCDKEKEIYEFLDHIFGEKEIRDYVMTHLASVLYGSTEDERLHIWSGSGGNGKSKIIELYNQYEDFDDDMLDDDACEKTFL